MNQTAQMVSRVADRGLRSALDDTLLEIEDLRVHFLLERTVVKAVNGVSLTLKRQSTLGVVGESGCGKSVTAMAIMRLIKSPPGRIVDGKILLHRKGRDTIDLTKVSPNGREIRDIRGDEIAMIFQEPMTSLNPLRTVGNQIAEMVMLHQNVNQRQALERAEEMLGRVHIADPRRRLRDYPHQMSGGMRQRVMIALALSCNPQILIADEPTTALDVTVQAQILDLMRELKADFHSSIMLITHNLGVVSQMADHIAVMYLGKVVEYADVHSLFHDPKHPYTQGLLASVPVLGQKEKRLVPISGMVSSASVEIPGCAFADRCPHRMSICTEKTPELREIAPGHVAACWLHQ
jgi:peptide/nickel transport system ATP-binding protein/oligopeptide transport system ATP-binding protein